MNTGLKALVTTTDKNVQYDTYVKKIIARKSILAHILINTIDEFRGMKKEDVACLIEGEVFVSKVPVDPGHTNKPGDTIRREKITEKIGGLNTEDNEINEGMIRYDIIFYVRMKDGISQIIVNIELQKDEPTEYKIINRGTFYVCRMISSQKDREFYNMDYDKIKQVYSIWICMNAKENCLSHIHFIQEDIVNSGQWKGNLDLLNLMMISLTNEPPPKEEKYELHRLLGALLSSKLSADEKLEIVKEYDIVVDNNMREEVGAMSSLAQGIFEKGIEEGRDKGRMEGWKKGRMEGRAEEVYSSVRDGDYSITRGMEKLNITDESEFRKNAAVIGIKIGFVKSCV